MSAELKKVEALARLAGKAALRFYGDVAAEYKAANSPVTAADRASNEVIAAGLGAAFPGDPILSEESRDSLDRLKSERLWIVDPLDGTKEFLAQNGEFSVMIGLAVRGEPVLGVVYLPAVDVLYSAQRGGGAWVTRAGLTERLTCEHVNGKPLRMVGSRSHPDPLLLKMQEALGITDVRPSGSVGIKCALIAERERDLYVHPVPYLKEWDTCAPEAILREAGGAVSDCTGAPLRYNKREPVQPHGIVACAPGGMARVLGRVTRIFIANQVREPARA
jgi:3'(2'), 5'-bisphosphate nucleotidase